MATKLSSGQKHMLRLIDRDKSGLDGWCAVSAVVYPLLKKTMPSELIEHREVAGSRAEVRLTALGRNIIEAMAWL